MAHRGLCAALLACVASAAPFVSRGDVESRGWREANPSLDLETVWYNPATKTVFKIVRAAPGVPALMRFKICTPGLLDAVSQMLVYP